MPRYKVVLEARGPLLLGDSLAAGNVQSSRSFVAGSVLRGALARSILLPLGLWRHSGRKMADRPLPEHFRQVFLEEPPASFGFLYPVREGGLTALELESFPLPLTLHTCKAHKGFTADGGHGVFDWLMGSLRRKAGGKANWPTACRSDGCPERLDRMRGFGTRKSEEAWSAREAKAEPRTFVRVGLNRWTETAEEGILYTLEALVPGPDESAQGEAKSEESDPPLSFVGYWTMTDTQWKALQALLAGHVPYEDDASSSGHPGGNPSGNGFYSLRIGTARARGMGEVALYVPPAPVLESELERRLDDFQPQDSKGKLLDPDRLYFALTLRSPLLMYDARGRPCMTITPETLADYAAIPAGLEPLERATYLEQELWSGWSPAWGLPKPVTPVLAPGSVLAFRAPVTTKTDVLAFMKSAEEEGLGEHRAEGWGEVAPCDPLHVQFDAGGMR